MCLIMLFRLTFMLQEGQVIKFTLQVKWTCGPDMPFGISDSIQSVTIQDTVYDYYDFEAALALLKLYQFRPSTVNREMAIKLLLKSLMQLPCTGFVILRCVLQQTMVMVVFM